MEEEKLVVIEWSPKTLAQALFVHAVVMPEIEALLKSYACALHELGQIED